MPTLEGFHGSFHAYSAVPAQVCLAILRHSNSNLNVPHLPYTAEAQHLASVCQLQIPQALFRRRVSLSFYTLPLPVALNRFHSARIAPVAFIHSFFC
jgi:hypothetical protein